MSEHVILSAVLPHVFRQHYSSRLPHRPQFLRRNSCLSSTSNYVK